jgi:hypothetical protein
LLRFPDTASIPIQTVPSKASHTNRLENKFRTRAFYEVIPNQDYYFLYGEFALHQKFIPCAGLIF